MSKTVLIWDLPLRIFHWSLVSVLGGLWLTSELGTEYIDIHMTLGYVALGLVAFRIVWGILGPKHSRFSSFSPNPKKLLQYAKNFNDKSAKPTAGHNPIGALMVFLMLILVGLQATSGLFISDDIFTQGPYFDAVSKSTAKLMNSIHHTTFDIILIAVALHIIAVLFYTFVKKHPIIVAMFTGKKSEDDVDAAEAIPHSKLIAALIIVAAVSFAVYWLVVINAPPPMEEYY